MPVSVLLLQGLGWRYKNRGYPCDQSLVSDFKAQLGDAKDFGTGPLLTGGNPPYERKVIVAALNNV